MPIFGIFQGAATIQEHPLLVRVRYWPPCFQIQNTPSGHGKFERRMAMIIHARTTVDGATIAIATWSFEMLCPWGSA